MSDMRITVFCEDFPVPTFIQRHVTLLGGDLVAIRVDPGAEAMLATTIPVTGLTVGSPRETLLHHIWRRSKEVVFGFSRPALPLVADGAWREFLREHRPDVVLAEFAPNGMMCLPACHELGIPVVVHFHGYDASALLRQKPYRRHLPVLFTGSSAVVVVSASMARTVEMLGCDPGKLHLIPCGAPVSEFTPSGKVDRQPAHFIAVADMLPVKGPLLTLRAFRLCAATCPGVRLAMIGGGGPLLGAVRRFVRANRLENVDLLGRQPVSVVRQYMQDSSVFLQHSMRTSLGHVEGWAVAIAEAAACGLPVIASRHGGIPDQVIEGATGFLVREADWKAMGEKMVVLARNPDLRVQMGLAGRANIEKIGNLALQIDKLKRLLTACAQRR